MCCTPSASGWSAPLLPRTTLGSPSAVGWPRVQQAAARLVWTGSWYEAEIVVDRGAARPRRTGWCRASTPVSMLLPHWGTTSEWRRRRRGARYRIDRVRQGRLPARPCASRAARFSNRLGRGGSPVFSRTLTGSRLATACSSARSSWPRRWLTAWKAPE